jgi:hypothetical protein
LVYVCRDIPSGRAGRWRLHLIVANGYYEAVQESGLWRQLTALKPVVCEPRGGGEEFEKIMTSYYDDIKKGAGGIFFAICRGKVCPNTELQHPAD